MKRLLVIPLVFSLVACAPIKEKIEDRTGSCPNGICSSNQVKPSSCNGSPKFSTLAGTFKSEPVTLPKNFVVQRSQYTFEGGKATYVQFCEKKATDEFESPEVTSTFTVNSDVTRIRFNQPGANEVESVKKTFKCKAELTAEILTIRAEGNCLVMGSGNKQQYFVKQ